MPHLRELVKVGIGEFGEGREDRSGRALELGARRANSAGGRALLGRVLWDDLDMTERELLIRVPTCWGSSRGGGGWVCGRCRSWAGDGRFGALRHGWM